MEDTLQTDIYKPKTASFIKIAIGFFIFVIILTGALFAYNSYLSSKNKSLEEQLTHKQAAIEAKQKNPLVVVYSLYSKNLNTIKKLEKQSDIVSYINHLDEIALKYDIELSSFNYAAGEIKTQAVATSDSGVGFGSSESYKKTADFIKKYRLDKTSLFTLSFVNTFVSKESLGGKEEQDFSLSFKIK